VCLGGERRSPLPLEICREAVVKKRGGKTQTFDGAMTLQWEMNEKSIPCSHPSFQGEKENNTGRSSGLLSILSTCKA